MKSSTSITQLGLLALAAATPLQGRADESVSCVTSSIPTKCPYRDSQNLKPLETSADVWKKNIKSISKALDKTRTASASSLLAAATAVPQAVSASLGTLSNLKEDDFSDALEVVEDFLDEFKELAETLEDDVKDWQKIGSSSDNAFKLYKWVDTYADQMNGLVSGLNRIAAAERNCLDTGDAKDVNEKVSKVNKYITKANQKLGSGDQVRTVDSMTWGPKVSRTTICTTVVGTQGASTSSSAAASFSTSTSAAAETTESPAKTTSSSSSSSSSSSTSSTSTSTSSSTTSTSTSTTSTSSSSTSTEPSSECVTISASTCPYTAAQDMKVVTDAASAFGNSMSAIIAMVPSGNPNGEQASLALVQATSVPLIASQALLRYTSLNAGDLSSALSAVENFVSTYLTLIQHFGSSVAYWVSIVTNTTSKPFVFWAWLDYYAGWMNRLVAMATRLVNMESVCLDSTVFTSVNNKIASVNSALAAINVSLDSDKAIRTVDALTNNNVGFNIVTCSAV